MKRYILALCIASMSALCFAQSASSVAINPVLFDKYWDAEWISCPDANLKGYGIFHFRKTVELTTVPKNFVVHVSGDNRYRLFVNGLSVCFGPARSDLRNWNYETVDIAPFLKTGKNTLAATVWNFGEDNPAAQISLKTAFILQGDTPQEKLINTNSSWKVLKDESYRPLPPKLYDYIAVGPGEIFDGVSYPWNWEFNDFDDTSWKGAITLTKGRPKGFNTGPEWDLVPRDIPFLEQSVQRFKTIRRATGCQVTQTFLQGKGTLCIPANTTSTILLDQGVETVAYPEISVRGSKGSEIELTYSEALFDDKGNKGNRNDVIGKSIRGITDVFKIGDKDKQTYQPLWFRTFRYIQLSIKTGDQPLTIDDIKSTYTVYPFEEKASFKCSNPELEEIWKVGWRTLRLCSNETHYDCPFFEQLQYVGDTRIQCLISAYVSGDDRLTRKAIKSFDNSRFSEGLTYSRYPSSDIQVIPPFSLFWINMIHDYWMLKNDDAFIKPLLMGVENILNWYESKLNNETNMLGRTPYWNFVDWPDEWAWSFETNSGGVPKGGSSGGSSILTLQYAYALNDAADLFSHFGMKDKSIYCKNLSKKISSASIAKCWNPERNRLSDTPDMTEFSQHANIMAIMADADLPINKGEFMESIANDKSLIQATIYYRFYMFQAMKKVGLGDHYLSVIEPWSAMIKNGLSTFSERLDPTRSDCHAWSASPTYEFLATVCGIGPAEPGFKSVCIEPYLGNLKWVEGSMPHEKGVIKVRFERTPDKGLSGKVVLPVGLTGVFKLGQKTLPLHEGINIIRDFR